MRKYSKNKKMIFLTASVLATTLILTGTFAWSVRLFSTTGGLGEDYHYIVKLLDVDTDPLFVINKWESEKLDKKVYATSSYNVEDIAKQYDKIIEKDSNSLFRDTWVRIKLEETFMRNGTTTITTVTEKLGDTLKSSVADGKYFTFDTIEDTDIILLSNWEGNHGRFWILDEDTGWLYWAQPLLATTELEDTDLEIEDQTTDHIIDEVKLKLQPAGVWEYTIKATLEAMDVELQGYTEEGAWNDIDETHDIYPLFATDVVLLNQINFPDANFRTWISSKIGASDKFLTLSEIDSITELDLNKQGISDLTGLYYFTNLKSLDVSENQLRYLDVTSLPSLNNGEGTYFIYDTQYHSNGITPLQLITNSDGIMEWEIDTMVYDEETGYLLINEHNFPDEAFRNYLRYDTGTDSDNYNPVNVINEMIDLKYLEKVTSIKLDAYTDISDLSGIEHFPKLSTLRASNNKLTSLTIGPNTTLTLLNVSYNLLLKDLDVSAATALTTINASNNPELKSLDVRNNEKLRQLYLQSNLRMTSVLLGVHSDLNALRVQNCQLSTLNIAGIPKSLKIDSAAFVYTPQKNGAGATMTLQQTVTEDTTELTWK